MDDTVKFATSGSTGEAKAVARSEASLLADAAALVRSLPEVWMSRPRVVATVRPEHMYGALWRVRAPAAAGSVVESAIVTSVEELAHLAKDGHVLLVTTPSFLEKALLHPDFAALRGKIENVITSGSLLRTETSMSVSAALGTCPLEIYGSTEAGTVAWRRQSNGPEWTLFDGVEAHGDEMNGLVVDSPWTMSHPFTMADGVRFVNERRFLLSGRLDRRVKVLEKYVSLAAVESAIESHRLVSRVRAAGYGDGVVRIGALVVLSPEGVSELAKGTCAGVASRLRNDLLPSLGETAFPRRIRFVREIPTNAQGKSTAADVAEALCAWCAEPVVAEWRETADSVDAKLVFPPDLKCFSGHFPEFPILPGVAQLYFIRHFAMQAFRDWPAAGMFRKLKFQKIITPGEEVALSISRGAPGEFAFSLTGPNGPCTSGSWKGSLQ